MNNQDLELRCHYKIEELLGKYFPNFVKDAAITRPEELSVEYNDQLPYLIESEFRDWLSALWKEVAPRGAKPFDKIMDRHISMTDIDAEYAPLLADAREKAERITTLEKIAKSNHKDVTYYKGLLLEYTKKLLKTMVKDFMEDVAQR